MKRLVCDLIFYYTGYQSLRRNKGSGSTWKSRLKPLASTQVAEQE